MHRWLKHPNYANLAEVNGWFESPWGPMEGPFSLCPLLPESLDFLNGLYDELLPNFRSRLCNVGCDETVDLGKGKSKAVCEQQGTGPVYLEFLLKIWRTIHRRNHIMQFWGDIILEHPELIPQLPDNVIALEWGYEATHPFADHASQFAQSGVPFYVCPGTSAWNSIVGRIDNALENLKIAAKSGLENGALGYLITDWGDNGHWQQLPISFPGYLAGAGYSWSYQSNKNGDIRKALDHFCLYDLSGNFGELMWTIGNLYQDAGVVTHNASILFQVMQLPISSIKNDPNLQQYQIGTVLDHLQISRQLLARCEFSEKDNSIIQDELELSIRMVQHACQRINFVKGEGDSQGLLSEIDGVISDYQRLWLHRSRPGGLEDSLARLVRCRADYI
jgi:hypothetical protein